jgi:hypothetical protein
MLGIFMETELEHRVYINTNNQLLCQKPSTDFVYHYDDNIVSKDSDHDGRALSNTDDNNNNDHSIQGHGNNDGITFDGKEEDPKQYLLINHGNVH